MRVLMFGWEFPPFQAGGLATATLGLVKGLLNRGIEVTLVVPFSLSASPDVPNLRLVSAAEPRPGLRSIRIDSPLLPYAGAEEYQVLAEQGRGGTRGGAVYGADLFEEVERYAAIAELIASEEPHDLIDTHDWITFEAGRRARAVSGKPLVAHIHATESDRCGGPGNPEIHRREALGLLLADRVVSNSAMLKRQVVERYAIPAGKIDVVHFGIEAPDELARVTVWATPAPRRGSTRSRVLPGNCVPDSPQKTNSPPLPLSPQPSHSWGCDLWKDYYVSGA